MGFGSVSGFWWKNEGDSRKWLNKYQKRAAGMMTRVKPKQTIRSGGLPNRSGGLSWSNPGLTASLQLFRTPIQVNFRSISSVSTMRTQPRDPFLQTINRKIQYRQLRQNRRN